MNTRNRQAEEYWAIHLLPRAHPSTTQDSRRAVDSAADVKYTLAWDVAKCLDRTLVFSRVTVVRRVNCSQSGSHFAGLTWSIHRILPVNLSN